MESLAAERLEIAQARTRARHTFASCGIEKHARLIAILGDSISFEIKVRQKHGCFSIVLSHGFPEPLGGFCAVPALSIRAAQIALCQGKFLAPMIGGSLRARGFRGCGRRASQSVSMTAFKGSRFGFRFLRRFR